jgi:hypothetical protein
MFLEILTEVSNFVATFFPFMLASHDAGLNSLPLEEIKDYSETRAIVAGVNARERR